MPEQRRKDGGEFLTSQLTSLSDAVVSALALKALDQRLANSSNSPPVQNGPSSSRTVPSPSVPPATERKQSPAEVDVADSGSADGEER